MDLILLAIPLFLLLIAAELLADRWRGLTTYRFADALNSLSAGMLSQSLGLLSKAIAVLGYAFAYEYLHLFELPSSGWVWLVAFVLYDFCYYWNHRIGHERNVFWAAHVVHHQSEEYNLSTALRQTSSGFLLSWLFYLPLAVLGIPPLVFVIVASLNLLYQFWVHTRHVPKLGWLEWIFITPSNHRVHHAQNPIYMDRNYGGVFILWDRLFGTFQEELDEHPVVFGVTTPLRSWNPLWANVQFYNQLMSDARRTQLWRDKLRIWWMPTGWRPADVAARWPKPTPDLAQFRKYDVSLHHTAQCYIGVQFALYMAGTVGLLWLAPQVPLWLIAVGCVWMALGLYSIGAWLEQRAFAPALELFRLTLNLPFLALLQDQGWLQGASFWWVLALWTVGSVLALCWIYPRRWLAV